MGMPRISASIPKPVKDEISKLAKRMGVTQSFMVGILLQKAVDAEARRK